MRLAERTARSIRVGFKRCERYFKLEGPFSCETSSLSHQLIEQIEYFKDQAARVAAHLSRAVGVGTVGSKESRVWLCREAIARGFREGRYQTRRDAQRMTNYPAEIFSIAWYSLVRPLRLIEGSRGFFTLQEGDDSTDTSLSPEGGTDTPTTDTTGESAA